MVIVPSESVETFVTTSTTFLLLSSHHNIDFITAAAARSPHSLHLMLASIWIINFTLDLRRNAQDWHWMLIRIKRKIIRSDYCAKFVSTTMFVKIRIRRDNIPIFICITVVKPTELIYTVLSGVSNVKSA